jgi:hypothetical protein
MNGLPGCVGRRFICVIGRLVLRALLTVMSSRLQDRALPLAKQFARQWDCSFKSIVKYTWWASAILGCLLWPLSVSLCMYADYLMPD